MQLNQLGKPDKQESEGDGSLGGYTNLAVRQLVMDIGILLYNITDQGIMWPSRKNKTKS